MKPEKGMISIEFLKAEDRDDWEVLARGYRSRVGK